MENIAVISVLNKLQLEEGNAFGKSSKEQFEILVNFIDDLIRNDFHRLLSILYRVDISEEKLRTKLAENKENKVRSAEMIAQLFIEREEEKILSRAKYRQH